MLGIIAHTLNWGKEPRIIRVFLYVGQPTKSFTLSPIALDG
jgi:hypothetical protein